jgi:hypothetical protein
MYLYEIYYINKLHPLLNRDDAAEDELTVALPEAAFAEFHCDLMDKWKAQVLVLQEEQRERRRLQREKRAAKAARQEG